RVNRGSNVRQGKNFDTSPPGNNLEVLEELMRRKLELLHKVEAMQQKRHSKASVYTPVGSSAIDDGWEDMIETVLQFLKTSPKIPPRPLRWIQNQEVSREIPDRKKLRREFIRNELQVVSQELVHKVNQGPFAKTTRHPRFLVARLLLF
ncbi:hypothetical protein ACJ72_06971, partial [Emergomyces africanus]